MWFYRRMLRRVRRKFKRKRKQKGHFYFLNRKRQVKFLEDMRKGVWENLKPTAHVEEKKHRGKQRITHLMGLNKWLTEQRLRGITKWRTLLRAIRERKIGRAMIAHILTRRRRRRIVSSSNQFMVSCHLIFT